MWSHLRFVLAPRSTAIAATAVAAASLQAGGSGKLHGIHPEKLSSSGKTEKEESHHHNRIRSSFARCEASVHALSQQIHFVTYNILCNRLVHNGHLKKCAAADLESSVRLQRIQKKLSSTIMRRGLIGLQEVSSDWAGDLHVFFARHGYQMIFAPYGEAFNGRMGVAFAYPSERFIAESVRLHHVGESLPPTPSSAPEIPSHLSPFGILSASGMAEILGIHSEALNLQSRYAPRGPTVDALNPRQDREWGLAVRRQNVAVLARLRPADGCAVAFSVGVYHMPCLFGSSEHRQTQNIHLLGLRAALANMAKTKDEPCILLGDFNIKPESSAYKLFCGAELGHEDAPDNDHYRRIYTFFPLTSAYALFHGEEHSPHALDYIWITNSCRVVDCPKLDATTPKPSATEPSDHLMVEAVIEVPCA
eukprot:TRINITY_DN21847_c0_g1_i1.p1 TRINITY_DN21847_c0_g1~~TRINITY_DN21847_c0_g1_i1.p1  ORF type:complete len:420 (+),score=39.38 TRINITY_DN21847_c0_g1_i1:184-1443(+)